MNSKTQKATLAGAIALLLTATQAQAVESPKVCDQVVQSLQQEWKAIGYTTPSKPTTMRVIGKLGHENTAAQVAFMQEQMRLAASDCQKGDQQAALQRVSSIHDLLDSHGISPEVANAALVPDESKGDDSKK